LYAAFAVPKKYWVNAAAPSAVFARADSGMPAGAEVEELVDAIGGEVVVDGGGGVLVV
jgi:ribulose 1,5-bisphosphate carboxylase large subunit-like protein